MPCQKEGRRRRRAAHPLVLNELYTAGLRWEIQFASLIPRPSASFTYRQQRVRNVPLSSRAREIAFIFNSSQLSNSLPRRVAVARKRQNEFAVFCPRKISRKTRLTISDSRMKITRLSTRRTSRRAAETNSLIYFSRITIPRFLSIRSAKRG